uniref:Uncharacterized protein n=1 Tax=Ascaris lumbricoides TaxID=6252 RepID=A0A0M3IMM6_ASCLU
MISARQRGTAREAIAKFSNIAREGEKSTKSFGSRSVTTLRGSATDAIHKFNKTATTNDEKSNNNDMTNSWELNSMRRRGGARDTIERFNRVAEINKEKLDKNPFSETYSIQHFDKNADDYGRPTRGSKTEARGIKAGLFNAFCVSFI